MEAADPDEPYESTRRPDPPKGRRRRPPPPPREPRSDLLKRRLVALLIGGVFLVLLLFGVRSCLDARQERAFENYLRDLDSLATQTAQLSDSLFGLFRDPGDASVTQFRDQINPTRGTIEGLLDNARGLDNPDELDEAQGDLELAYELRRDGVTSIVEQVDAALGEKGSQEAIDQIAEDMRQFLASDVLYARARAQIEAVLTEQELGGQVPSSTFLPAPIEPWLDRLEVARLLAQVAGESNGADSTRGTELSTVVLRPGNVPLTPDSPNQIGKISSEVEVGVVNGGLTDERDVTVSYELLGSTEPVEGEAAIARIAPGETGTTVIPISGEIPTGDDLTLIVTVFPVPGETIVDNNELAFQVRFGGP